MIAFYGWITVVPYGWQGAPVFAVIILGLVVATLKWGVGRSVDYWEAAAEPAQVPRVMLLIVVALVIQLLIVAVVLVANQMSLSQLSSTAVYFLVWTGVPLAMIALGVVRWPRRTASPGPREVLMVAAVAILFAGVWCYIRALGYDGPRHAPTLPRLLLGGAATLLGATMEEVVFRVLLLTALVRASGSRTQALIISSVIFALAHLPPALAAPVIAGDWIQLPTYFEAFVPELILSIGGGLLLGALWLRTGSIILISIVHALWNLGPVLVGDPLGIW
ncbi:MAG: type II CAAX prenyl endopeptidase Rce1 family protein [bacterium]|jgi:membrane protease YdiL (CAAX protease family)